LPGGGAWFNFPTYPNAAAAVQENSVIRLIKYYDTPQSFTDYKDLWVYLTVQTQGSPEFFWKTEADNTCDAPASVRPTFFAWVDFSFEFVPTDEWWSHMVSYTLAPGSATLGVPFSPDQWSDALGSFANFDEETLSGFDYSLSNLHGIGLSLGGGCDYGHGVSIVGAGEAKFVLTSLTPTD
jgi:hypothetical protein